MATAEMTFLQAAHIVSLGNFLFSNTTGALLAGRLMKEKNHKKIWVCYYSMRIMTETWICISLAAEMDSPPARVIIRTDCISTMDMVALNMILPHYPKKQKVDPVLLQQIMIAMATSIFLWAAKSPPSIIPKAEKVFYLKITMENL